MGGGGASGLEGMPNPLLPGPGGGDEGRGLLAIDEVGVAAGRRLISTLPWLPP